MRIWFALVLAPLLVACVCGWEQGNPLVVRLRGGAPMEGWHPRAMEELSPTAGGNACFQACLAREECTSWTSVAAGCATWTAELDHIALNNLTGGGKAATARRALREEPAAPALCYLKTGAAGQQEPIPTLHIACEWASGVRRAAVKRLRPLTYKPLPLGTVRPTGWLEAQLRTQANGLSGHLSLFWEDIMDSVWVGGTHDNSGAGHERGPYWLNGVIPLAALLNATGAPMRGVDVDLTAQIERYVSYILDHQTESGWLGPDDGQGGVGNTYWTGWNTAMSLLQYSEARGAAGDTAMASRCNRAVLRYVTESYRRMLTSPMASWSQSRWQDWAYIVHALMDQAPQKSEQMLWDAAALAQQQGFDWDAYYSESEARPFEESYLVDRNEVKPTASAEAVREEQPTHQRIPSGSAPGWTMFDHGVNNAMATKGGAVWYRQSFDEADARQSYTRLDLQQQFHGQPYGMFGADEVFSGRNLNRGIELCAVVEQMYSLQHIFRVQGDPMFLDVGERVAYNALPGTITPDMWGHQYLQQANEISAAHTDPHAWVADGPDSTVFGVEPNFGCCTANFNQGWPKLAGNVIFESADGGVAVGVFAPVSAVFPAGSSLPTGTRVEVNTRYPFGDTVEVVVDVPESDLTVQVPLHVRIPGWATQATMQSVHAAGGTPVAHPTLEAGAMHTVLCSVGQKTTVTLQLNPAVQVETGWGNAAVIKRKMDRDGYTAAAGALAAGNDVHSGQFTLAEAKAYCNSTETCTGFTLHVPLSAVRPDESYHVFFKGARATNSDQAWTAFFKVWGDEATNAAAVVRGPLLYALQLEQAVHTIRTWQPFNNTDFELQTDSVWNIALVLDSAQPSRTLEFSTAESAHPTLPFDTSGCPLAILAQARVLSTWALDTVPLTAAEPPPSPVTCNATTCGYPMRVRLMPYGATNLRIAGLPWVSVE